MDNATFDKLPDEIRLGLVLQMAEGIFGEATMKQQADQIVPLIRDMVGHGDGAAGVAGDTPNPADNYWGGVWQVYDFD